MSALKRTDGSPVTRSRRLALREWGSAYRPRGLRRRSRRRSPREGKPHTGRRAAGDWRPTAARYASCGAPQLSWGSSEHVASAGDHCATSTDHCLTPHALSGPRPGCPPTTEPGPQAARRQPWLPGPWRKSRRSSTTSAMSGSAGRQDDGPRCQRRTGRSAALWGGPHGPTSGGKK